MRNLTSFLDALPIEKNLITLIDVGARWGANPPWNQVPSRYIKYVGFEPDAVECERLMTQFSSPTIKYYPIALGETRGSCNLNITREPGCTSTLQPNEDLLARFYYSERWDVVKTASVSVSPLSDLIAKESICPDVLKIDVQGAALGVLKGLGKSISDVLFVDVEVEFLEMYKGQPLFSDVDQYLRGQGFELVDMNKYYARRKILDLSHSSRGQVLFSDAYYVRTAKSLFETRSDLARKKRDLWKVIVTLCVYGQFDMALEYALDQRGGLSEAETSKLRTAIETYTARPAWRLFFFNNALAEKFGFFLSILGNFFQMKSRSFGWSSDLSAVDVRYKYLYTSSVLKWFRK
jgi:FkbM family methyltransferase